MLHLMLHHPVEGCRRVRKPDLPDIGPQNSMLIDSHTHIQFPEFDADRDAVIKRALEAGIWMVNVGTNVESSKKAVELAHQYKEGVYASVGIHPHDADADCDFTRIEELARDPKVVGIGETGLDYFRISNSEFRIKEEQKELFLKHIETRCPKGRASAPDGNPRQGDEASPADSKLLPELFVFTETRSPPADSQLSHCYLSLR